ncbi:MAG: AbrB/MazE/SpoVT family DNA-binding domain-containing protein [Candidatus Anammoxibacter sp.]
MRVTTKGQVTIPKHIREKMDITPNSEIDFEEKKGEFYLTKTAVSRPGKNKFSRFRGIATVKMSTDEIMALTRGR